jgi:hypothetical protein
VAVRVVVAAVVALAALAGVLAWRLHAGDTYVVPPGAAGSTRPAAEQPGEAAAALSALQRAVTGRRPGQVQGNAARILVANAAALRVQDFTARYIAPDGAVGTDGSWTADVALTWRFGGVDRATASAEVSATFAPVSGGVRVTGFGAAGGRLPLWLAGPVQVRRSDDAMVVLAGTGPPAQRRAQRYDTLAERAVATVRKVLPWQHPDLVLEVPADEAGLERMMGATSGGYRGVAAVTATVDGSAEGPVHVLVNPQVIGGLNSEGAQIVLSHEATHAATDVAVNDTLPPWLLEGFADYVALRDVALPLSTTARQVLADVRKNGAPAHLPGAAEFDDQSESFGAEYEAAWLACRLLARLGGEQALVRLYDAVRDGADLETTMRAEFGFGIDGLTTRWRDELEELAR